MSNWARRSALLLALAAAPVARAQEPDASEAFFAGSEIPELVIELDDAACAALKEDPRAWAVGGLTEKGGARIKGASFKLKGAAGSFRELDDLPSFTVRVDKGEGDPTFHGLKKFHLNKSVQDDTYLHELLGAEIFHAAGIPASRVAHAHVWINERDLGLYVLKEGFDKAFLKRNFGVPGGNLYDAGFCQDIDTDLERDEGSGPNNRADLKALAEACADPDPAKRWERVEKLIDVKGFLTFVAIELMLGHWDGYSLNRNNYRVWFDPASGKAVFLPHGMDQLFQDPSASILVRPTSMVARAVMSNPAWRAEYRKRLGELLPLFDAEKLNARVEEMAKRLRPVLSAFNADTGVAYQDVISGLKDRLIEREKHLKEENGWPEPRPLALKEKQQFQLTRWHSNSECDDAELVKSVENGVTMLAIRTGPSGRCIASWRRGVVLTRGRYRLRAKISTKDVEAIQEDEGVPGGVAVRLSGGTRENPRVGTSDFTNAEFVFEVTEVQEEVELVIELRSSRGEVIIRGDSLWLTRMPE